ncbi:hypothetical protein [Streptomyces griseorubiginosus]|uniref:hypothetical protein n=1 Tax=Streptomyces griseorubiginosus TaxID=67304 RepID=UPI003D15FFAD
MAVALELADSGEGLQHELHGGQQLMDAQRHLVALEDVEHSEGAAGAADEPEHLGDGHDAPGRA